VSKPFRSWLLALCLIVPTVPSLAGPFADDMAKCLVRSATPADKTTLVQWMFAFMTLHPDVKQFASTTVEQRTALNKSMADLMVVLLSERCFKESSEALKNEGMGVIRSSFELLGKVAAQELFSNPAVAEGLSDFGKGVDSERLKPLLESVK
jgi:hypothetical protein